MALLGQEVELHPAINYVDIHWVLRHQHAMVRPHGDWNLHQRLQRLGIDDCDSADLDPVCQLRDARAEHHGAVVIGLGVPEKFAVLIIDPV
ncbi:hypothetical protein HYQ46_007152 [Verticillium longisporum]|nr:hypothetical protein HYQ46_007152 [Verticillium longisporum]